MKYKNQKKYYNLDLQLFADGTEGSDGEEAGGDDQDDDEESDEDGEEEKKYSEKDIEDVVKKRLARERRKWQRAQQKENGKTDSGDKAGESKEESEDSKARKAAEDRASKAEVKIACYEAGVAKDAVDDVTALAKAYMEADEDLDLEDAIEKVVKKYPQFKKGATDSQEDETKNKSWGQRQNGRGTKKLSGVEERFYELNPDLRK